MSPMIRPVRESDLERLREIERLAGWMFAKIGMTLVAEDEPAPIEELRTYAAAGRGFVADIADRPGIPAGYLLVDVVDGVAHLEQVTVDPAYSGQGLGTLLVERAVTWARDHGYPALTLTTFTDVPWNAPWYKRLGFHAVESPAPGLLEIRNREKAHGLDRWPRTAMRREL